MGTSSLSLLVPLTWPPFTCPVLSHTSCSSLILQSFPWPVWSPKTYQVCSCLRKVPLILSVTSKSTTLLLNSSCFFDTFSVEPPLSTSLKLYLLKTSISKHPLASLHTVAFIFVFTFYTFIFSLLKTPTGVKVNEHRNFVGRLSLCLVHTVISKYLCEMYSWTGDRVLERCLGG